MKLGIDKLWKNAEAKRYAIIFFFGHLAWSQGVIYAHFAHSLPIFSFFWINFTKILWFSWDLLFMSFDSPKDLVFGEMLIFTNIFGFRVYINWLPKFAFNFTFKFNFGYIPLEWKWKLLKYSSTPAFLCLKTTSGESFSKIEACLGD